MMVLFLLAGVYLLTMAMEMGLPIITAYVVRTGIGATSYLVAGIFLFGESSDAIRLGFVLLMMIGIVGVRVTNKERPGEKAKLRTWNQAACDRAS